MLKIREKVGYPPVAPFPLLPNTKLVAKKAIK